MKRILAYLFIFLLVFNSLSVPVYAADDDLTYSCVLEPDEDGKYWIYFEIVNPELRMLKSKNDTAIVIDCNLSFMVDVTEFYTKYNTAGLFCYGSSAIDNLLRFGTITLDGKNIATYHDVIVNGYINGVEYNYTLNNTPNNIVYSFFSYVGYTGYFIHADDFQSVRYLPWNANSYATGNDLAFMYYQKKPVVIIPAPQEPVFEYASTSTGKTSGVNVILRYPYDSAADYYAKENILAEPPLYNIAGTQLTNTVIDVKLTCDIGGVTTTTYWAPLGSVSYDNPSGWVTEFLFDVSDVYDDYLDTALWASNWEFMHREDLSYLHLDLSNLPDHLSACGIQVGNKPVTLLKMEVSAQNYHTELEQYSDLVYSSFDFNTQEVGSSVISNPGTNVNGVGNITVNNVINSGYTSTLPSVNNSNTVNQGDTNVTVNNNIPGDINLNITTTSKGDEGTGIFGWLADKTEDAANTVAEIDENFNNLLSNIDAFTGRFPTFFGWVYSGLPEPFQIWITIAFASGVVLVVLRKMKIW